MKEPVILESLDSQRVTLLAYDEYNDTAYSVIGVTSRRAAFRDYRVVGELFNGKIKRFDDDSDFSEVYDS